MIPIALKNISNPIMSSKKPTHWSRPIIISSHYKSLGVYWTSLLINIDSSFENACDSSALYDVSSFHSIPESVVMWGEFGKDLSEILKNCLIAFHLRRG